MRDKDTETDNSLSGRISRIENLFDINRDQPWLMDKLEEQKFMRTVSGVDTSRQQTAFEAIMDRIQGATDRICRQAGKLEEIGVRILGELPKDEAAECSATSAGSSGTLDYTFLALSWLDGALSRLEVAAQRLELI